MAIAPALTETVYGLAGVAVGPFNTVFPYATAPDVSVYLSVGAGPQLLARGPDYSLAGATPLLNGGAVTLDAALPGAGWPAGARLIIVRSTPNGQPSQFGEVQGFSPQASEDALDGVARQVQDLRGPLSRALTVPFAEAPGAIPPAATRAGKLWLWDAVTAQPALAAPIPAGTLAITALATLLLACASLTSMRALLKIPAASVEIEGLVAGDPAANHANSAVILAAMAAAPAAGVTRLVLPAGDFYIYDTIDIKYPHLILDGAAFETFHDSGAPSYATRLIATKADWMVKVRTPYAAEQVVAVGTTYRYSGSGIRNVSLDGGAISTGAALVDSVSGVDVDVYGTNFNAPLFYKVQCGITGVNLGEACDVQNSRLVFRARAIDTAADRAADILVCTGSINANVSLNNGPGKGIFVLAQHKNGRVFLGESCDNNQIWINGARVAGGVGELIHMSGVTAGHPVGGDANVFQYVTGQGAIVAEGTDTAGVTAGVTNRILERDSGNTTPPPTAGTGSYWRDENSDNIETGATYVKGVFADSSAAAKLARAALGSETVRIRNGASNHVVLEDGVNAWSVNVDSVTGDLRLVRLAGAGAINFGNGVPIKLPGFHLSNSYANDAAAAAGGVALDQLYRNGSAVQCRMA